MVSDPELLALDVVDVDVDVVLLVVLEGLVSALILNERPETEANPEEL